MARGRPPPAAMSPLALVTLVVAALACARADDIFNDPSLFDSPCTFLEIGNRPNYRPLKVIKLQKTLHPGLNTVLNPTNECGDGYRLYVTKVAACTVEGNTVSSPFLEPEDRYDPLSRMELTCRVWPRGCPRCPKGTEVEYIQICDAESEG